MRKRPHANNRKGERSFTETVRRGKLYQKISWLERRTKWERHKRTETSASISNHANGCINIHRDNNIEYKVASRRIKGERRANGSEMRNNLRVAIVTVGECANTKE